MSKTLPNITFLPWHYSNEKKNPALHNTKMRVKMMKMS